MKRIISAAALTVALASMVPLAAAADSMSMPPNPTTASIPLGSSFDVVDKATGQVLGRLVAVGNNTEVIAKMADVARSNEQLRVQQDTGYLQPRTTQEWQAYWNRVLPSLIGG